MSRYRPIEPGYGDRDEQDAVAEIRLNEENPTCVIAIDPGDTHVGVSIGHCSDSAGGSYLVMSLEMEYWAAHEFIQSMIDALGYFRLPKGTSIITDSLLLPNSANGALYSGEGMEQSILTGVGMSGKALIDTRATTVYVRLSMRDFRVGGDADTAIKITPTSQAYECLFVNIYASSSANSAMIVSPSFSCKWDNVQTSSINGHGFELQGGNSTLLTNCYAHNSGAGKAGYRIKGIATMIGCNGVDSGDFWGWFGATISNDGFNSLARISLIGCNLEDFGVTAIKSMYQTHLNIINTTFVAKNSGTYNELILLGTSNHYININNTTSSSKGSTRVSPSAIVSSGGITNILTDSSTFSNYYQSTVSLTYTIPNSSFVNAEYGINAYKLPYVTFDRNYGFNSQIPNTWTVNSTTFSATGRNKIKTGNTISTTITNATGGVEGQELYIEIKDAFTIISHLSAGTGRFKLLKGSNLTAVNGEVYHFVYDGTIWVEVGSENSIYSKIDSPTFTGTPLAPTATSGTKTTQIATTAFAQGIRPYKVYTAILTQVGTDAPTAIVLENTIGSIVWSRTIVGGYFATLSGAFTTDKTSVLITNGSANATYIHGASVSTSNVNVITASDGQIDRATIEIRVYN